MNDEFVTCGVVAERLFKGLHDGAKPEEGEGGVTG